MKIDSAKISGFIVLFVGVAVLLFTLYNAYQFLLDVPHIGGSQDLMTLFGNALAPLIMYAIRALYLGIMGWIGSILTRRGVQIITGVPKESKGEAEAKAKETKEPKAENAGKTD